MTSPASTAAVAVEQARARAAAGVAAKKALTVEQKATMVAAKAGEGVIATRERAAVAVKKALRGLFETVNPYDVPQVNVFAAQGMKALAPAQTAVARAAAAGVSVQLAALGIKVDATPTNPVDVRAPSATIRDGKVLLDRGDSEVEYANGDTVTVNAQSMTTEEVLKRPAAGFRWIQSEEGLDAAEQAGLRIDQIVDDQLMLAQRLAEAEVLAKAVDLDRRKPHRKGPKVTGYRRVIHPELSRSGACGLCIAAADKIYRVEELRPIHANCKCTVAPITSEHDPGDALNKIDLEQLYSEAGGTSAAHLKRTRYKADAHGELGAVLVPKKPYTPRDKKKRAAAQNNARAVRAAGVQKSPEQKAEIAARHLPQLEKSLADLRARGVAEDSKPVTWHKEQIEKFRADLATGGSDGPTRSEDSSHTGIVVRDDTNIPTPAASGGGGDDGGDDGGRGERSTGFSDPDDRAVQSIASQAAANEPSVSQAVRKIVQNSGGDLQRYETRLKTPGSIAEKLERLSKRTTGTDKVIVVDDALRYTWVADNDATYWRAADSLLSRFKEAGFQVVSDPEGWRARGYRGRNIVLQDVSGYQFEIQLHTSASLEAAEKAHRLYVQIRKPGTGSAEKKRLRKQQEAYFTSVPWPVGVPEVS